MYVLQKCMVPRRILRIAFFSVHEDTIAVTMDIVNAYVFDAVPDSVFEAAIFVVCEQLYPGWSPASEYH